MGFFSAIPVGASQIEVFKRVVHNHFRAAIFLAFGSMTSDMMYGFIAIFGLVPFLQDRRTISIFGLAAAVVLGILAYLTLRRSSRPTREILPLNLFMLKSRRMSYLTGFSIGFTNPLVIFWWLATAKLVSDVGIAPVFTRNVMFTFVIFGGLGLDSYLILLAFIIHRIKHFISDSFIRRTYLVLGFILVFLSLYFLYSGLRALLSLPGHM
jgi:threonine/homoserine/homoserine lactone efflux protein